MSEEDNNIPNEVNITLDDIQNVIKVIDTVSLRGAFRGDELEGVGSLRSKFAYFIQSQKNDLDHKEDVPEQEPTIN